MLGLDDMKKENDKAARRELESQPIQFNREDWKPSTDTERESTLELMINGLELPELPELPAAIPDPHMWTLKEWEELGGSKVMELLPNYTDLDLPDDFVPQGFEVSRRMCISPVVDPMHLEDRGIDAIMGGEMFIGSVKKTIKESKDQGLHNYFAITCVCDKAIQVTAYIPEEESEILAEYQAQWREENPQTLDDVLGGLLGMLGLDPNDFE